MTSDDDAGTPGGTMPDAAVALDGPSPDAGPSKLWVFTTNTAFDGHFGQPTGGRVIADIKCDDMYKLSYTQLQCTQVHAVIQVDNNIDTLARMGDTYKIPVDIPVFRASDGVTKVTNNWNDLVDPNVQLLSAVSASTTSVLFWSGRATAGSTQCNGWQSNSSTVFGSAGDVTQRQGWISEGDFHCDNPTPHLLCICW